VLSRIAESLFWVGRYQERAEDTARLLDVQIHQLLENATTDESSASAALLSVMGVEVDEESVDLATVVARLAFDDEESSSVVSSLISARANASGVRESISSELWECLNSTYVELEQRIAVGRALGPNAFFRFARFVKDRVSLSTGIADSTMSRDDGWWFFVLGRCLERVDMTVRLLSVRLALPEHDSDWVTTLRCCSAHEAYLKTYRGAVEGPRSIEFLLLDRLFPRSVYFALSTAEACLEKLDDDGSRVGHTDDAYRLIGRIRAELEYQRIDELLTELPTELQVIQQTCSQATAALATRFFKSDPVSPWRQGSPGGPGEER
jgi:uncharacterized alpha-E superfamily protein